MLDKLHKTLNLCPTFCPVCNYSLEEEKPYFVYDKIITDLFREQDEVGAYSYLRLLNIKLKIHRRKCPVCKEWVYFDQGIIKDCQYGIGLFAYVMSKRIIYDINYYRIIDLLTDNFGFESGSAEESFIDWFYLFEEKIENIYHKFEELIKKEAFFSIDINENIFSITSNNWWLWIICISNLILYKQSFTSNQIAIKGILNSFKGTIVADFFRVYEKFNTNEHQKLLAHFLSDLIKLIVAKQKENVRISLRLKKYFENIKTEEVLHKEQNVILNKEENEAIKRNKKQQTKKKGYCLKPKSAKLSLKDVKMLKMHYNTNQIRINQALELGLFFRNYFKDTIFPWKKTENKCITLEEAQAHLMKLISKIKKEREPSGTLDDLLKLSEKYLHFLFTYPQHEEMSINNNLTDKNIRKFLKQRKNSRGFKNIEVAKHLILYISLYLICVDHGRDFNNLIESIQNGRSVDLRDFLLMIS